MDELFILLDLFMNCIYLELLCSKQEPGSFNIDIYEEELFCISFVITKCLGNYDFFFFFFSVFTAPGKRGLRCDKALTNTVRFFGAN